MSSQTIDIKYILGILNSKVGRFIAKMYVSQLQKRQYRMLAQFVEKFPIPKPEKSSEEKITKCIDTILDGEGVSESALNSYVYELFNFTENEIRAINNFQ